MSFNTRYCCNPFKKVAHVQNAKGLRKVQQWMTEINNKISISNKICYMCRRELYKLKGSVNNNIQSLNEPANESSDSESEASVSGDVRICKLNESLTYLQESPICSRKIPLKGYRTRKLQKITTSIKTNIFPNSTPSTSHVCPESEIIEQLKEKFKTITKNSEKIQLLTILPKSWTLKRMEEEFQITNFMARKVKNLVETEGVLSTPNPKLGKPLSLEIVDVVKMFYESDDVSRCLPGCKDYVSITENGVKVKKTKRLLLGNLREVYALFKEKHEGITIGISKFCELRPKNVVLADASGSHNVCVCKIHQNTKLMLHAINLKKLTENVQDFELETYKDCLKRLICNPPSPNCYLGRCSMCPDIQNFKEKLGELLLENEIDEIIYKQWISVDRDSLETIIKQTDSFLDSLCEKLQTLLPHSFVSKEQGAFMAHKKSALEENEYLVICDFSENATFVVQDSVQGFLWNNSQATLYPIAIYYKSNGKLETTNFIIISDCLIHNTVAVHLFHRHLNEFLKNKFLKIPKKIFYFSDGSSAQFKNKKNFANLCHHSEDFNCSAEWHFFATSHGKGPSDGLGGTVKREARRASLQRPFEDQITTPLHLYNWCQQTLHNCNFAYLTEKDYEEEEKFLTDRFIGLRTIPGTQKQHSFIPISKTQLQAKIYSADSKFVIENIYNKTK